MKTGKMTSKRINVGHKQRVSERERKVFIPLHPQIFQSQWMLISLRKSANSSDSRARVYLMTLFYETDNGVRVVAFMEIAKRDEVQNLSLSLVEMSILLRTFQFFPLIKHVPTLALITYFATSIASQFFLHLFVYLFFLQYFTDWR